MPVRRFRSVEEMGENARVAPDDPRLAEMIRSVWHLAEQMAPRRFRPGVYKHRSIEELNQQEMLWEEQSLRAHGPGSLAMKP